MEDDVKEYVVLTPKSKTTNSTVLVVERCAKKEDNGKNNVHIAGGEHHGIIVNKTISHDNQNCVPADIVLEFRVYLVNAQTGAHTQESRSLKFWFKSNVLLNEQSTVAQQLFQDLVSPTEFPRDYIGFIKKIMKLMQNQYTNVKKIEIELKQLEEIAKIPKRPLSADESILGTKNAELSEKKLLEIIESFYPNPVTVPELSLRYNWEEEKIKNYLNDLQNKGLVKPLDHGAFTRKVQNDVEVQIVKQMPNIVGAKQPTIAIITAQYCEKVAVDSLIENKETYVRYTTVGESNVYTLGNIGVHRVVCTKLPTVGHTREAMIAAGNTTTRLLGTFQKVDFVLLVGVGGGVPHYTDYKKHVRLGDVVISHAVEGKKYIYTYCENAKYDSETGTYEFETKDYHPTDLLLQEIAMKLKSQAESNPEKAPWLAYIEEGIQSLKKESSQDFCRPSIDSDKLYMCIGEKAIIEVAHPIPSDGENKFERIPRIHTAPIAAGRVVSRDEQLRQAFALHSCALAFDSEFDSVIESVIGSCRESFAIVRGIADYRDGTKRSEWQPFASISAAAVVKSIISVMKEIS